MKKLSMVALSLMAMSSMSECCKPNYQLYHQAPPKAKSNKSGVAAAKRAAKKAKGKRRGN